MVTSSKLVSSFKWSAIDRIGFQSFKFVSIAILARLLSPEEFGIVAIATFFVILAETFVTTGFTQAYIRQKDFGESETGTIFALNMITAMGLGSLLYSVADYTEITYGLLGLSNILKVLSTAILIDALSSVYRAELEKKLEFKRLATSNFIGLAAGLLVSVPAALSGFGVWTLVIQTIVFKFVYCICVGLQSTARISSSFDFKVAKIALSYGFPLQLSAVVNVVSREINTVIIGKSVSASAVGLYTRANSLQSLVVQTIVLTIEKVTFPILAKLHGDPSALLRWARTSTRIFALVSYFCLSLLFVHAESMIYILFGADWMLAADYLRLLVLIGGVRFMQSSNLTLLKVIGKTRLILLLRCSEAVVTIFMLILFYRWKIKGLIIGQIISAYIVYIIMAILSQRHTQYYLTQQVRDVAPFLLLGIAAATAGFTFKTQWQLPLVIDVIVVSLLMTLIYSVAAILFGVPEFRKVIAYFKFRWRSHKQ